MPNIVGRGVNIDDVNKILESTAKHILESRGGDAVASRKDIKKKLATLEGPERALVDLFYRFTDHRDAKPGARITKKDIDATLEYAKRKLVERLDRNGDSRLSNDEIAGMSRIGKLAVAIARAANVDHPAPPSTPTTNYSDALNQAIEKKLVTLKTKNGEITAVRVTSDYDTSKVTDLLGEILDLPNTKLLAKLNIGLINEWDGNDTYSLAIEKVVAKGPYEKLENVFIGDFEYSEESEISWVNIGSVGGIYAAAPNMTDLKVQGGGIDLGNIEHDNLRTLTLHSGGLPAGAVRSLNDAKLPQLERLEVWFGTDEYGGDGDISMLDKLMRGTGYPQVKHLGLQNSMFQDDIAKAIVDAPILAQLETLDLSMGAMGKDGAQALIDNASKLSHLKSINVDDNMLPPESIEGLKAAFGDKIKIGTQDRYDPDDDYRYVSVSE